jgi:hypothetical protein
MVTLLTQFLILLLLVSVSSAEAADKIKVDLELVIATDVSRSIDEEEARLQREGVAAALRSPYVLAAIRSGFNKKIAIAYIDYSSRDFNEIIVDWRIIKDKNSADNFADSLIKQPLTFGRRTSISDALELATSMIQKNNIDGTRRTIDIAGDGPNNHGRLIENVRKEVIELGITINGLPIINDNDGFGSRFHLPDLDNYYRGCVIGGAGAFLIIAKDFQDFARAIRRKLVFEIARAAPPKARVISAADKNPEPMPANGFNYKKGCDIGERMRQQIWGDDP